MVGHHNLPSVYDTVAAGVVPARTGDSQSNAPRLEEYCTTMPTKSTHHPYPSTRGGVYIDRLKKEGRSTRYGMIFMGNKFRSCVLHFIEKFQNLRSSTIRATKLMNCEV
jgi:hypothetical protein